MNFFIFLFAFLSINNSLFASNYFDKKTTCISSKDLESVSTFFPQYKTILEKNSTLCKNREIDSDTFEVLRTLAGLKKLSVSSIRNTKTQDDFSLSPIKDKNWWGYLTARANKIEEFGAFCLSNPTTIAYVNSGIPKTIHLCPLFYNSSASDQLHILMHEARHFDGHRHVRCTQGQEVGAQGACDETINNGGSYGVSVQSLVSLSNSIQLSKEERILAENNAIYYVNNKFNSRPNVKSKNYIYLANRLGEVYRASSKNLKNLQKVTKLQNPSRIYSNGKNFTIYPIIPFKDSYRLDISLKNKIKNIGSFGEFFNKLNYADRIKISSFDYFGSGSGFLMNGFYYTNCTFNNRDVKKYNIDQQEFKLIFSLKYNSNLDSTFLLSKNNEVFQMECDPNKNKVSFKRMNFEFPEKTIDAFSFDRDSAFILNRKGEIHKIDLKTQKSINTGIAKLSWISATPMIVYDFFD